MRVWISMRQAITLAVVSIVLAIQLEASADPVGLVDAGPVNLRLYTNNLELLQDQARLNERSFDLMFDCANLSPASITNMISELRAPAFLRLISEEGGARKPVHFRENFCLENDYFSVEFSLDPKVVDPATEKRFSKRVRFYINGRFSGHTTNFLYQAIQESKQTNVSVPFGFPLTLMTEEWVPKTWTNLFFTNTFCAVIDGPFAWVYHGGHYFGKRDAKEYAPEFQSQFESARKEASEVLKAKNIQPIDTDAPLNEEMQKVLKVKYHIDWQTPEELRVFDY